MTNPPGGTPDPPRIEATNPWGSLRAWVDDDGMTVYLCIGPVGEERVIEQSVWVRNDVAAPEVSGPDIGALDPLVRLPQPRRHTKHPYGKPLVKGQVMELLWLEAGDGVALVVDGEVEAILPAWSGVGGLRGYAAEARGRGPVAWELVAPNPLTSRVARARAHWDALNGGMLWPMIESADVHHLERVLGKREGLWVVTPNGEPPRRVSSFRSADGGTLVYATIGMASQPMPRVEADSDEPEKHRRVSIALATRGDDSWVPRVLGDLARYPWRAVEWIGDLHVVGVPGIASGERVGELVGVLLTASPPPTDGVPAPSLGGQLDRSGDPVLWLWALPVTESEALWATEHGTEALLARLAAAGAGWVHDPARAPVV